MLRQLSLVLTERCNYRCPYCYQSAHAGPAMGHNVIEAVVQALQISGSRPHIHFFGGEPLIVFDLLEYAVDRFNQIGVRDFSVTTNGSLLTPERASFLRARNFTVIVSMDGGSQAQTLREPRSLEYLNARLKWLFEAFSDRPAHVSANAVVTADNIHFLSDSVRSLTQLGFRRIALSPVFDEQTPWPEPSLAAISDQFQELERFCLDHLRRMGWMPLNKWDGVGLPPERDCGCALVNGRSYSVHTNGDLSTCLAILSSKLSSSIKDAFRVGSVFNGLPDLAASAHQCASALDRRSENFAIDEVQRGRGTDTYGCPLSVLLAPSKAHLRHHEVWSSAQAALMARIPKRRNVFARTEGSPLFQFAWTSRREGA
ncbi:MAG: radical SAM protein [Magnetospirillum gryphiswaldense]|nr:radical SAM protein [Magnetospirillum gryphiswaldense]